MKDTAVVILAAGKGKRMNSDLPKGMITFKTKPMLAELVDKVKMLDLSPIIIVAGYKKEVIFDYFKDDEGIEFAIQKEQLGTADALLSANSLIKESAAKMVLVLSCDVPAIKVSSLREFLKQFSESPAEIAIMTTLLEDPGSYGRIVRDESGKLLYNVEAKDASDADLKVKEINGGIYIFKVETLFEHISKITNNNIQQEYYLTDIINIIVSAKKDVMIYQLADQNELRGANTEKELEILRKFS